MKHNSKKIIAKNASWTFDNSVPKKFDYHIDKSVPLYEEFHWLARELSDFYLKDDYGAEIWYATVINTRSLNPDCSIEILTPDFKGYHPSLEKVFSSRPNIFSHNIECVERISRSVRPQSVWSRSKDVLRMSIEYGLNTKTGMMVGLGETDSEVYETMDEMVDLGISIFNIGQYLQPTKKHIKVNRYVTPDQFNRYKEYGLDIGFKVVESGPLVRSSYMADKQAKLFNSQNVA